MNWQFHNKRQSLTNKPVWTNYSTDQKNFTGHMFNIKLEQKSYKMRFKALPVKRQRSKTEMGGAWGEHGRGGVGGTKFDLSLDLHDIRESQISC